MISVIVPVYKSEKTLERCVKSLCSQTYDQLEILLVVDGPPDQSGVLAEELAARDKRIRVIWQENQGVSAARNRGLEEATGEFIRFVDSDDYVDPDSLARMIAQMEKEDVQLVIAGYHHHYYGRIIGKKPSVTGIFPLKESQSIILKLYTEGFLNMPWNKLYRKDCIRQNFPTDLNLGEDLVFNMQYLEEIRKFAVMEESVCEYIQDEKGTTLSTRKRSDKIAIAFRLYRSMVTTLRRIYKNADSKGVLESKLVVEFLDDIEGLAFDSETSGSEKRQIIRNYGCALHKLLVSSNYPKIELKLLDYKIIYFFFSRNMTGLTYGLILLRGIVVKIFRGWKA